MRAQALATTPIQACVKIAVVGSSACAFAAALYLSARGHDVRLESELKSQTFNLHMRNHAPNGLPLQNDVQLSCVSREAHKVVAGAEVVLLAGPATAYADVIDRIGAHLMSTQTMFLLDAPLCASFEVGAVLANLRKDLSLCIVETGPLFDYVEAQSGRVKIDGVRSSVPVCGMTVNATRQGLSVGELLWSGLVPASNSLERIFGNALGVIEPARTLLELLAGDGQSTFAAGSSISSGSMAVLERYQSELSALARLYGVSARQVESYFNPAAETDSLEPVPMPMPLDHGQIKANLAQAVKDNIVPLSEFARVGHLHVPVIDSVIELATCVTATPLRKQGRQLSDMGFIGMDFNEIVDAISL